MFEQEEREKSAQKKLLEEQTRNQQQLLMKKRKLQPAVRPRVFAPTILTSPLGVVRESRTARKSILGG